ncbi:response regulator [Candidatus Sumerlaeota bacterium]|nr:response regulator [Candidatus Sumerlaeota bacterium]
MNGLNGSPRILFVDDDPHFLSAIRRLLRKFRDEWTFEFANSVDEAVDKARETAPDVVVSDFHMPLKNGFDLVREIRALEVTKDTPVIIVTGNTDEAAKRKALDLGATDLLNKPVNQEDLIARLRNSLRLKEYQDTIRRQNEELEQRVRERTQELEVSRLDIIWRLAKAGEYRDEETGNHIIRVGHYARILCSELELDKDFTNKVFLAAPLHDIGKIGIPDSVLLKPGRLDPDERAVMERHCEIGANILMKPPIGMLRFLEWLGDRMTDDNGNGGNGAQVMMNPLLQVAATIAIGHHEKWDGSGYPNKVAGEDIPVECRVVALADVYDALRSERPYKKEFPIEKTLGIIQEGAGTHFDPQLVEILNGAYEQIEAIRADYSG